MKNPFGKGGAGLISAVFVFSFYGFIIFFFQVRPVSDFEVYYRAALRLVDGKYLWDSYKYFQPPGYPLLLAVLFYLFKTFSIFLPQLLNGAILIGIGFLSVRYPLVKNHILQWTGFFLITLNVYALSFVPLINSEIPYSLFFTVGILLLGFGLKIWTGGIRDGVKMPFLFTLSGVSFGISQAIRSTTTPYLFLWCVVFLAGLKYFRGKEELNRKRKKDAGVTRVLLPLWMGFLVSAFSIYSIGGYGLRFQPYQNGLWNIYVGLNEDSMGKWNPEDHQLIAQIGERHQWDLKKINEDLWPFVLERARKNGLHHLIRLPQKIYHLLDPKDIPYWSVEFSQVKDKGIFYKLSDSLWWLNAAVFLISLFALIGWLMRRSIAKEEFFVFTLIGAIISYVFVHGCLLEVQPRYIFHLWMTLFWCFPTCLAMMGNTLKIKKGF